MDMDTIRTLQGYGYIFFTVFLCVVLYAYWFHLKKSEKTGRRNYEKYGNLALNDTLDDAVLESCSDKSENANKEVEK